MIDVWHEFYCGRQPKQEPVQFKYWVRCWNRHGSIDWCKHVSRDDARLFLYANKFCDYKRFDVEPLLRG